MTQMNAAASTSSPQQCFSQTSSTGSELASPDGGGTESMVGSNESLRDRSHLFLDIGSKRGPGLSLKPRTNFAVPLHTNNNNTAITTSAPTTQHPIINGFTTTSITANDTGLSPMLPKDFLQVVNAIMSPANRRPNFPLTHSLQQSAFNNLHKSAAVNNSALSIAETPTPTKILYPKQVTQEAQEFADGFTKVLEELQQKNQFSSANLNSPSANLLFPILNALTPTNPSANTSAANNASAAALNAIIQAVFTPTPTQTHTTEQLFAAALANLAGTPTNPSPTTNFSSTQIQQPQITTATTSAINQSLSNSVSVATGGNQASAPIPTTTSATQSLGGLYKNLDSSGLMDHMFANHGDINFPGLMSHFNGMPPHSQAMNHNGYHQPGLGIQQGPPQQPGLMSIKNEPGTNGYGLGHSLQGASATGMCQPPPQNLSCAPSTSSHQISAYQNHLSNSNSMPLEADMTEQERRKLDRKRARNRMAASKCRQRKIERITQLEGEVQQERQRYQSLQLSIATMKETIDMLQNELSRHKHAGCSLDKSTFNLMSHLSTIMNNNNVTSMDTM